MDEQPINSRSFAIAPQPQRTKLWSTLLRDHEEYSFETVKRILSTSSFGDFQNELVKYHNLLTDIDNNGAVDLQDSPDWVKAYASSISSPNEPTPDAIKATRLKTTIKTLASSSPDTLKNLWQFQQQHPQKFDSIWQDFMNENISREEWCLNPVLDSDIKEALPFPDTKEAAILSRGAGYDNLYMEHSYQYTDDGNLKHIVNNIDGTGLSLCLANDKVAILNSSNLTFAQSEALEKYFVNTGKWPESIEELNKIMTKDQEGNDIPLGDKIKKDYPSLENESREQPEENYDQYLRRILTSNNTVPGNTPTSPQSNYNHFEDILNMGEVNSYGYIKPAKVKENKADNRNNAISVMKDEFVKKYGPLDDGSPSHPVSEIHHGIKTITLSFWPKPGDRAQDSKIDSKKHIKNASTKIWAATIYKTYPPKIALFIPSNKNFNADDASVILKYFSEMGCTCFKMPQSTVYGKEVFNAFLEASVTSRLPLKLKPDGMDLKPTDILKIDKFIQEKLNCKPEQKIDYLLRWSRQLEGLGSTGNSIASTKALCYKQQARFLNFNTFCVGELESFMKEQVDNGSWTDVDVIAAKIAMTKMVTEISKGRLGDEPWDPSFGCTPEQKQELKNRVLNRFTELHGNVNKVAIGQEIKDQQEDSQRTQIVVDPKANIVARVDKKYDAIWNNLVNNKDSDNSLASLGVSINSKIFPISTKKSPLYQRSNNNHTPVNNNQR